MYRDISTSIFKTQVEKILKDIEAHEKPFFNGFYTGATQKPKYPKIELTKELYNWLNEQGLLNTCTYTIHVLKGNTMHKRIYLKDFISINDLKPYINYIDNMIHMKEGA